MNKHDSSNKMVVVVEKHETSRMAKRKEGGFN